MMENVLKMLGAALAVLCWSCILIYGVDWIDVAGVIVGVVACTGTHVIVWLQNHEFAAEEEE